jgi:hypothetical protein
MEQLAMRIDPEPLDPDDPDPGKWGHSVANLIEIMLPCLDAARVRSLVEVGAYAGDLTQLLLEWASGVNARVWAIDPAPQDRLVALDEQHPDLELVRAMSHDALRTVPMPDAVIIDGDHNYYTVACELRIIAERCEGGGLPLLLFHDVCWPHARRDAYYTPELIPEEHRQPMVEGGGLFPGVPGLRAGGLPYKWLAAHEGGPRNGVLTAVEDFVAEREGLKLAIVPAFFGFGVVWEHSAPWAADLANVLAPYDRHPVLERLEANRVYHLASVHYQMVHLALAWQRIERQEAFLRKLLVSKTFSVAERLSKLRQGGEPAFSKDEVRRVLGE